MTDKAPVLLEKSIVFIEKYFIRGFTLVLK